MGEVLSLFGRNEPAPVLAPGEDPDGLRPYQREAVDAAEAELQRQRATLEVLATGLGKTQIASVLARQHKGGVLAVAHRDELTTQMRARLIQITGEYVGLEQAGAWAGNERIVVGSIQTLTARDCKRAKRFAPDRFSLIITDEAHHSVAKTYKQLYGVFPNAKLFGMTATAGRKGLKSVYETVAYKMDLAAGIEEAWLTPIDVQPVDVSVDLDGVDVDKKKGDFVAASLEKAMAEVVAPIARAAVEHAGDARTLIFTPGVQTAHATAEAINAIRAGSARAVDGEMDKELRRSIVAAHKAGAFPYLVNCRVFTEGYDDPGLRFGIIAAPTMSWALYAQMLGRYTRLWPGIDKNPEAAGRAAAIATSPKPKCVILDLACNSEKHELAGPIDLLGGRYTEKEKKKAKEILREKGGDPRKALEEARAHIQRAGAVAARAKVTLTVRTNDPFSVLGVKDPERGHLRAVNPDMLATAGQMRWLDHNGIEVPEGLTKRQASKLIGAEKAREGSGLCNYRQVRWLAQFGLDGRRMYKATGKAIADAYRANGKLMPSRETIESLIRRPRDVGAEG